MSYLDEVKDEIEKLSAEGMASLPIYDPTAFNYRPVGGEKLVGCLDGVQLVEVRNTGRHFRGGGFWETFWRGFLGRNKAHLLMGSPTRVAEKAQQVAATGQLIVTDKAVVFEGDARNERLTWRQVADVGPLENGVMISRRTGKPRVYVFTKTEPRFSAVLWIMSHRT